MLIIGLNPSTADESKDDPTIRRCVGFANREGYETLVMMNLFAYRATDPSVMKRAALPIGIQNDEHLIYRAKRASLIIAAWGAHGTYLNRDVEVLKILPGKLWCLGVTRDGIPRHPLMLPRDAPLTRYSR